MNQDNSHIRLGKRIKKSKQHPLGWQYADAIPPDEPCILALPGSSADNSKKANGFAKMIEEMLKDKSIPIYSVEYDYAGRISVADREAMLNLYNQGTPDAPILKYHKEDNAYIPQYIRELYQKTFAPRLRNQDGSRASIANAARRLNMLVFANHCQGSTVSFQLERLLKQDMSNLGWTPSVQDHLLKQVHNVDVAPVIPYGITKTTTFKFVSLSDEKVTEVKTPQTNYILKRKREHERFMSGINGNETERKAGNRPFIMNFTFFRPTGNETVFAVNNIYPAEIRQDQDFDGIEHTFDSYSDKDDDNRTKQGDQLSQTFREVINWLAEHAKKNKNELTELPDIFKQKRFSLLLARAQNNRYDFITKEIKLQKSRHPKTELYPKSWTIKKSRGSIKGR